MVGDPALQIREGKAHIFDGESIHLKGRFADVAHCHRDSIHHNCEGVADAKSRATCFSCSGGGIDAETLTVPRC